MKAVAGNERPDAKRHIARGGPHHLEARDEDRGTVSGITFFTCDPDGEHEANWLAGCLLLPRRVLYPGGAAGA
jgi:hypothetical protein